MIRRVLYAAAVAAVAFGAILPKALLADDSARKSKNGADRPLSENEIEVCVRQTSAGPRLFVDGKPVLPRSVLVSRGSVPQFATDAWTRKNIAFRASWGTNSTTALQFRFAKRFGWTEVRDFTLEDDVGNIIWGEGTLKDEALFNRNWRWFLDGTTNSTTFVDGAARFHLTTDGVTERTTTDQHVYSCRTPELEKGKCYHAKFEIRGDVPHSSFSFRVYQVPKGTSTFIMAALDPDPFRDTATLARDAGVNFVFPQGSPCWKKGDVADFTGADAVFDSILEVNPNAIVFYRAGYDPPKAVLDEHPDWRTTFDDGTTMDVPAVACRPWRKAACGFIEKAAKHFREKYPRNFGGFHIASQNAGEWLYPGHYWKPMNGFDTHTLSAWREWLRRHGEPDAAAAVIPGKDVRRVTGGEVLANPVDNKRYLQFYTFQQEELADAIAEFAATARRATDGKKLVMFFYGYTYEMSLPASGHHGVMYLLDKCGDTIDSFCGPISYGDRAWPGACPCMAAVETLARRGILWWNEDDTRTYLANEKDFGGGGTKAQSIDILTRNNFAGTIRGFGSWWMDLHGGGWFLDRDLWNIISSHDAVERALFADPAPFEPELAMIVDEGSLIARLPDAPNASHPLVQKARGDFERCGMPYGQYILEDVLRNDIPAKVQFHLASWRLADAQRKALKAQRAARPDLVRVWCWAPGYVSERDASEKNVSDLTGFTARRISVPDTVVKATPAGLAAGLPAVWGKCWGKKIDPLFTVEATEEETWSRWSDGSPAVVVRGKEVFCGVPQLPPALISAIAKRAGAHVWAKPGEAMVWAKGRYVFVYSYIDGKLGLDLGGGQSVVLDVRVGESRVLPVGAGTVPASVK